MTKYTITYQRKVQVKPYEMLTIGLTEEFEGSSDLKIIDYTAVRNHVDNWIEQEKRRLGAS